MGKQSGNERRHPRQLVHYEQTVSEQSANMLVHSEQTVRPCQLAHSPALTSHTKHQQSAHMPALYGTR
jgi:hypothetical protein